MKLFVDRGGFLNAVCPVKMWTKKHGRFSTVMVRFAEPQPDYDPEDPYCKAILMEPCKLPETEEEFNELIYDHEEWIHPDRCRYVGGRFGGLYYLED